MTKALDASRCQVCGAAHPIRRMYVLEASTCQRMRVLMSSMHRVPLLHIEYRRSVRVSGAWGKR